MDIACSTCLESFTLDCDVSTTPCGHVFHTKCIHKWIKNERRDCPQCRQSCSLDQLMKIYFSGTNNNSDKETKTQRMKINQEKKPWTKVVSPAIYTLTGNLNFRPFQLLLAQSRRNKGEICPQILAKLGAELFPSKDLLLLTRNQALQACF